MQCTVCRRADCEQFGTVEGKLYWRCHYCLATFLDPSHLPSSEVEVEQYRLHENHPDDPDYRRFLDRLAAPLLERLPPAQQGLDYGCGPGPALAAMLREAGHCMALFDPFFQPDRNTLERRYDFITCTEVVEHMHHPVREFQRFDALLKANGWLAVMTQFQTDDARFANWHYRRDPTHVVFYRQATFYRLAEDFGWRCEVPCPNVVLLQKVADM
ncbi:MAG: class I SAM-dependent methyltransferase [Cellvibrionaceae bacterium]